MILLKFLLPTILLVAIGLALYFFDVEIKQFISEHRRLLIFLAILILIGIAFSTGMVYVTDLRIL